MSTHKVDSVSSPDHHRGGRDETPERLAGFLAEVQSRE